jgi:hypothetical protein
LQYINSVTSNVQTQLDSKQNTLVTNDITTSLIDDNAVTTAKIDDGAVTLAKLDSTGATSGDVPTFDGTNIVWDEPAGGGGLVDGDYGDIIVSGTGTVMTIDNNVVDLNQIQQIGAYKTLANITGSTANISEVNIGYTPNGAVTLSGDVTYEKSDFAGRTHLLLSTNSSTTRRITISNNGFTDGDFICLLINQNSSGDVSVTIGTRAINSNRGNIINALFDGTNWHVWSGGGVFNTSSSIFTKISLGFGARIGEENSTATGYLAQAINATNTTATGANSVASAGSATATGANTTASGTSSTAEGNSATASGASSTQVGASGSASALNATGLGVLTTINAENATGLGFRANVNNFIRQVALGAYTYGRRYGAIRSHLGVSTSSTDATNPSLNKEWCAWSGTTTNDTITEIFLRGVSSNRCVLQAKNTLKFRGQAVAFRSDYSGTAGWDITGLIKRDASNVTTLVGVTATLTHSDGTGGTLVLTIDADDTNESLRVRVTGNASETWTWGVELELLDLRIA